MAECDNRIIQILNIFQRVVYKSHLYAISNVSLKLAIRSNLVMKYFIKKITL